MLQLMREGYSYTYPPLSIASYSFIQLSELELCRVNKLVQGFNTAAQDSNPDSRSRESEALPLSHCALQVSNNAVIVKESKCLEGPLAENVSQTLSQPFDRSSSTPPWKQTRTDLGQSRTSRRLVRYLF